MTERELAENICKVAARNIVDDNGGSTMGGIELGERYASRLYKAGGFNVMEVEEYQQALRHWVEAVGYNDKGEFEIVLSSHIINC